MATQTLIFVRHGQYQTDPKEILTQLGQKQAQLTGKRLSRIQFDKIYSSKMPRAIQTTEIILNNFKSKARFSKKKFLNECVPGFPKHLRKKYNYTKVSKLNNDKKIADKAYEYFFQFSKKNSTLLIICHGNIIRYLICRALNLSSYKWLDFDIKQCGICEIKIKSETKQIQLISHNDVGHMPIKLQTFI